MEHERVPHDAQPRAPLVQPHRRHARLVEGVAVEVQVHSQERRGELVGGRRPDGVREVGVRTRRRRLEPRVPRVPRGKLARDEAQRRLERQPLARRVRPHRMDPEADGRDVLP